MATINLQDSLSGRLVQQENDKYQQYLQEKRQKSQELGFTYDISDRSYEAILAGEKAASQMQGMIDTLQQNKQELAALGLDDNSINALNTIISESMDPVAMQNDLLTAVAFSENMGITVSDAMQNLDGLLEAQFFTPVAKGKTAAKAVKDSFYLGTLTLDRGHLGSKLMRLEPDTEEYNKVLAELQEIDAEMAERQDWMARPWYTELLKLTAQTLPYSMESITAGSAAAGAATIAGTFIPGAAPLIALSGIAAGAARFVQGFDVEAGNLYYDLKAQGIDDKVAKGISSGYGVVAATIEQALGGTVARILNGAGIPVKSVASKITTRMISSGTLKNAAAVFGATWGTDLFINGAEEFLQSFSSSSATNLAYVLSDMKAPNSVTDMLSDAWEEGVAGVAGSLFLGGLGAGMNIRTTAQQGIGIANAAQNIHSKAQYESVVNKSYRPESVTDEDWKALTDAAWDMNAKEREMTWSKASYASYAGAEISTSEKVYSPEGKAYEAYGVEEMKGKSLFFQDRKTETTAGTVHTMTFGNPEQLGVGASTYNAMLKQSAQEELTAEDIAALQQQGLKMPKIGEITYRTRDGKLEILSASMEDGYTDLQRQAVEQILEMYPDHDIQWSNPGELQSVYDDIVAANPQGEQAGLNYGKRYASEDTEAVKRWIGDKFSSDQEEQSVMAAIVQAYAGRMDLSGEEFISKYLEDIGTIDETVEAEIRAQGVDPEKVKGFTKFAKDGARAIIYAGKNADISTFDHELNHVVMSIGDNKADFEKAVHDAIKTNRKRLDKFIQQNLDIIKSAKGKDGKYDPTIVDKLYQRAEGDKREWTRAEEEFEAELFEAYRRKGETLNPELKGVLRRIAEAYRHIYRSLRNALGTSLNEEIRDYYDRLHGFDRTGADQGRDFSSWTLAPNLSLSQQEVEVIKDQAYLEQFAYIRDKYVGTENYLRAPNGKASNLTEEQWIMVRTPNFKAWFGDWENDPANASKVVDDNGEPMVVYHGSRHYGFEEFNTENFNTNIGSHFGVAEAAMVFDSTGNNTYSVFLNLRNILEVEDIFAQDTNYEQVHLASQLARELNATEDLELIRSHYPWVDDYADMTAEDFYYDVISDQIYKDLGFAEISWKPEAAHGEDTEFYKVLRGLLEKSGYDGLKYANYQEGDGDLSWVALYPNQIKSATDNSGAFSPASRSILYQTRENMLFQNADYDGTVDITDEVRREFERAKEAIPAESNWHDVLFQLKSVASNVQTSYKGRRDVTYAVSMQPEVYEKFRNKEWKEADFEIESFEQARFINTNEERLKDWQQLYADRMAAKWTVHKRNGTLETKNITFGRMKKNAKAGKVESIPCVDLSIGCQRIRTVIERIKNGIMPADTPIESCYGGTCFVNLDQAHKLYGSENVDTKDLVMVTPDDIRRWFSFKTTREFLQKDTGFIRMGFRGDCAHSFPILDGYNTSLAETWLQCIKDYDIRNPKTGELMKTVFITAGYAPTTEESYARLVPFKDLCEIHVSTSGWFSKNELMLRLAEFDVMNKLGLNVSLRVVTDRNSISDSPFNNTNWLKDMIFNVMKVPQTQLLGTAYHNDRAMKHSLFDQDFVNQCCVTGKCKSCNVGCMVRNKNSATSKFLAPYGTEFVTEDSYLHKNETKPASFEFEAEEDVFEDNDYLETSRDDESLIAKKEQQIILFQSSDGNTDAEIENGTLYISHSLSQEKLMKTVAMGGFPMPSMAITTPSLSHRTKSYGDIVLIGGWKLANDAIQSGSVYDRDLWSPMYPAPQFDYDLDEVASYIDSIQGKHPDLKRDNNTKSFLITHGSASLDQAAISASLFPAVGLEYIEDKGIAHAETMDADSILEITNATRESYDDYIGWVKDKLSGLYDGPYLMVSGERKPYDLQGVFEQMASMDLMGNKLPDFNTTGNLYALLSRSFSSREEMRQAERNRTLRSKHPNSAFHREMGALAIAVEGEGFEFRDYNNALDGVRNYLLAKGDSRDAMVEAMDEKYRADSIIDAAYELAEAMKTRTASQGFFEAKPNRIVSLNEFTTAVVPSTLSSEAYDALVDAGLKIVYYSPFDSYRAREDAIIDLVYEERGYLFQDTPQDIWLEDIQSIANDCTDFEQFRIAVEAFAMGEPTETSEADIQSAWERRQAPVETHSYTNTPEEVVDFDYDANWDDIQVDYGEQDYEMMDDEAEEFLITSWAMARGTDVEQAEEARTTLDNPNTYHVSREDKQEDFVRILDEDDQLYDYLSTLRRASRTIAFGSERDLDFDPSEDPARYQRFQDAAKMIEDKAASFIRNVVHGKKDSSWDIKSLPERTKSIIRGMIAKNPGDYMNLYYMASGNDYWQDSVDSLSEIEQEAARLAVERGLTISEKRKLAEELNDKALEDRIIRTGDITDADVKGLLTRKRQRAAIAQEEVDAVQAMLNERIEYKDGQVVQLTLKAAEAEKSLYEVSKDLSEVNEQLEHTAASLAKKAKGMGIDTKLVQEQQSLLKKKAYLERLYAQRTTILKNLYNEGKYYGKAGEAKVAEIEAKMGKLVTDIVALEQAEVLTTEEAIKKIISLTSLIDDKKARERLYDAVTIERWKGVKKLREAQEKADRKLRDTVYTERLKASKARQKAEVAHYEAITWERWKAAKKLNEAQKEADSRVQAQQIHDAITYGKKMQRLEEKIESMKIAKAEERAARRLRKEMQRLADSIKRAPSSAIHLDEAEQILKIQMAFDPAFRSKMRVEGVTMDINDLKDILKNDPSNPLLTMLSEDQLRRLLQKSLDQMDLAELQAVFETVKNLREKGRAKRLEYVINQRIETRNIQSLLINQLLASDKYKEPELHGSMEERERRKSDKFNALYLATYNMARHAQMLDGGKKGSFYNLLIRRKREMQNAETRGILERRKSVEEALEANGIDFDAFYTEAIETEIDGKKASFTLSQLAYVYFSKNNDKNRAAIAYGNLISQSEKTLIENGVRQRIIGQGKDFDKARRDAINEEIRTIGDRRYDQLYAYAEEALMARPAILAVAKEIEASLNSDRFSAVVELMRREFNTNITRESYYLPISRVGFVGESPAERLKADILNQVPGMRAAVDKGMTVERQTISPIHQTEIDMDLVKVWDNSIYDQEHLLAFLEYSRLLDHVFKAGMSGRTRELREAIENSYGPAMMKSIDTFVNEVANPSSAAVAKDLNAAGKIFRLLRGNIYAATFGFRVSSVLNQLITSPAAFLGKVNPIEYAGAALEFAAHPIEMWNKVCELSTFMLERDADIVQARIREAAAKQGQSKAQATYSKAIEISMLGMKWSDRYTVGPGWYAIFKKELNALGGLETPANVRQAVKVADEYVQETQPQGDVTELSALVKSDSFSLIAPFQTALNQVWQDVSYDIPAAFREGRYAEALGKSMGYAIAGVMLALVHGELQPDEDDEKRGLMLARRIFYAASTQFSEGLPLAGDMLSGLIKLAITGEKDSLYFSSPFQGLQNVYNGFTAVYDKKWGKALESILYGVGQLFGAPVSEIKDIRRAVENEDVRAIFGWRD